MVVQVCDIKFLNPDGTLEQVRFPDFLEDAREGSPKLHRLRATSLSIVSLTLGLPSSGFTDSLRIRYSQRYAWGSTMMWESLIFTPKKRTATAAGRRMLNPSCILRCISPRISLTIYRVHCKAWGPFEISVSSAQLCHGSPVCTGMPSST